MALLKKYCFVRTTSYRWFIFGDVFECLLLVKYMSFKTFFTGRFHERGLQKPPRQVWCLIWEIRVPPRVLRERKRTAVLRLLKSEVFQKHWRYTSLTGLTCMLRRPCWPGLHLIRDIRSRLSLTEYIIKNKNYD